MELPIDLSTDKEVDIDTNKTSFEPPVTQQYSKHLSAENSGVMDKLEKEAMTHKDNENAENAVPESLNEHEQKRQCPIPSDTELGYDKINAETTSPSDVLETDRFGAMELNVMDIMENNDRLDDGDDDDRLFTVEQSSKKTTHLYISPFHPSRTEQHVMNYLAKRGINSDELEIKSLLGREYNRATITFVPFKVSCTEMVAEALKKKELWPPNTKVEPFNPRTKYDLCTELENNFMQQSPHSGGTRLWQ